MFHPTRCGPHRSIADRIAIFHAGLVDADPEAEGAFDQALGIDAATAERAEAEAVARSRHCFSVATGCRQARNAIAHFLAGNRVGRPPFLCVLLTAIQVNIEARVVHFERGQALLAAEECQRPIGIDSRIWQAAGAVATNAATFQSVQSEVNVMSNREPAVSADTAAIVGRVIGASWIGSVKPRCKSGCR